MKQKMFLAASHLLFANARLLRRNMTHAELKLWSYLKDKPLGFKFRRQHPLGIYIADFYCHWAKLVIELDGRIHERTGIKENDKVRQKILEDEGLKVLRFSNEEVFNDIDTVLDKINNCLTQRKSSL